MKFEGEYLNGERNGKGKEYKYDKVIFEGEYINGKKWKGKGREYYNSKIIFEGEFQNGKRWNGKGIEYEDRLFKFEGEYLNGKKIPSNKMLNYDWIKFIFQFEKYIYKYLNVNTWLVHINHF